VVSLRSVGSIVAAALARVGVSRLTIIDHDRIETRNLDRALGAVSEDVTTRTPKVLVAAHLVEVSHTAPTLAVNP
jgi:tRNA A37 threonylcarbamoyladenosine dehydratase